RHADVHEDDVGLQAPGCGDGLDPVARLANDAEVRLALQDQAQAAAHQHLVVDEKQADGRRAGVVAHVTSASTGTVAWTRQPGPGVRGPAVSEPPTVASRSDIPTRP